MRHENRLSGIYHVYSFLVIIGLIAIDQVTKYLVRTYMYIGQSICIIPGYFNLVYVMNPGGAFGFWADKSHYFRAFFFFIIGLLAIVILIIIYFDPSYGILTRIGIVLLLSGAIGNIIDRIRWRMVVDFLDFYWRSFHWPAFNVADTAISIGMGLFLLELWSDYRRKVREKSD
ncbi:MAG: signal peptidase II [bacterium]